MGPPPVTYVVVADNARQAAADAAVAGMADAISIAIRQATIISAEMRAKGYRLVTPQQAAQLAVDETGYPNSASYSRPPPDPHAPLYPNPPN